jgi:hypothetical protein
MITNDARCTREIKARIFMEKAAFNEKKTRFISRLDLNLTKKLAKCYIWSIVVYRAENWTLRKQIRYNWKVSVVLEKNGENHLDRSCEK